MPVTRRHAMLAAAMSLTLARTAGAANQDGSESMKEDGTNALRKIRHLDYTVIYARDMDAMRRFYADIMQFPVYNELGREWITYRVGASLLALTERGAMFDDAPTPKGALSLQMAFRVAPGEVDACAAALAVAGVAIESPPTDRPWGHRTLFFRDPDGNVLEIYADI